MPNTRCAHMTKLHQLSVVDFMEEHPRLLFNKYDEHFTMVDKKKLWDELAYKLNSQGPSKKAKEKWIKSWTDWKSCVRRKVESNRQSGSELLAGNMNEVELRLAILLYRDELPDTEEILDTVIKAEIGEIPEISETWSVPIKPETCNSSNSIAVPSQLQLHTYYICQPPVVLNPSQFPLPADANGPPIVKDTCLPEVAALKSKTPTVPEKPLTATLTDESPAPVVPGECQPHDVTDESQPQDVTDESQPQDVTDESQPHDVTDKSPPHDVTDEHQLYLATNESQHSLASEEIVPAVGNKSQLPITCDISQNKVVRITDTDFDQSTVITEKQPALAEKTHPSSQSSDTGTKTSPVIQKLKRKADNVSIYDIAEIKKSHRLILEKTEETNSNNANLASAIFKLTESINTLNRTIANTGSLVFAAVDRMCKAQKFTS